MRSLLTITGICAVLAFAGCGGDDDNDSSSASGGGSTGTEQSSSGGSGGAYAPPAASTEEKEPAASGGSGGTVTIKMQNIAFAPNDVSAKVGQTVKWENEDTVDHNVVADKGEEFKSKNFGQGGTYSYKLDEAGTIQYECTLHPGMTGTITVTK